MDYKLVHNVQNEDCFFNRSTSNSGNNDPCANVPFCPKKPLWRGFLIGILIGCFVTLLACVIAALVFHEFKHGDCKCRSSNNGGTESLKLNGQNWTTAKTTTGMRKTFSSSPGTTGLSTTISSTTTSSIHTCRMAGGCMNPPTMVGTDCVVESADGRTSVRFTMMNTNTVDPFDNCPVSVCTSMDKWSVFNISISARECYTVGTRGAAYSGKNTCTITGRPCQRWDTDLPHKRNRKHIPKNYNDLFSNYCRDPGPPYDGKPWCYTTDSTKRWEYCHVKLC